MIETNGHSVIDLRRVNISSEKMRPDWEREKKEGGLKPQGTSKLWRRNKCGITEESKANVCGVGWAKRVARGTLVTPGRQTQTGHWWGLILQAVGKLCTELS